MIFSADELVSFVNGVYSGRLSGSASMFMAAPIFGSKSLPVRPRVLLTLMNCVGGSSRYLPPIPVVSALSVHGMLITIQQVVIGVAMGFTLQMVFRRDGGCRSNHGDQHGLGICRHDRPAKRGSGAGR